MTILYDDKTKIKSIFWLRDILSFNAISHAPMTTHNDIHKDEDIM